MRELREEKGAFILEAAIVLIVFFALVFAIIELSFLIRRYASVQSALVRAAHALQGASSGERIMEDQSFQHAATVFYEETQRLGIPISELTMGKIALSSSVSQDAILAGRPCTLVPIGGGFGPPGTYRLMARLRWRPVVSGLIGFDLFDIHLASIAVIESSTSGAKPQATPNVYRVPPETTANGWRSALEVPVYMPALPLKKRTQWVEKSKVEDSMVYDDFCSG